MEPATVVDMGNISSSPISSDTHRKEDGKGTFDLSSGLSEVVANQMWNSGKEQAEKYFSVYANIDLLRPYFDVEPRTVLVRLFRTFVPLQRKRFTSESIPNDMYGPCMLVFTLVAILMFSMKASDHSVKEGTLIGASLGLCFGYWAAMSFTLSGLTYMANSCLTSVQIISLTGYSMTAACFIVGISTVFHPVHSHLFFMLLWVILGGLTLLRMILVLMYSTQDQTHKLVLCGVTSFYHLLFLLYLHFAFHSTVESINDSFH